MKKPLQYALRRLDGRLIRVVGSQDEALHEARQSSGILSMEPHKESGPLTIVAQRAESGGGDSVLAALQILLECDPENEYLKELRHNLKLKYPGGSE